MVLLVIYAIYMAFILTVSVNYILADFTRIGDDDEFIYRLEFIDDGRHNHYTVERWDANDSAVLDVKYVKGTNSLLISASNLRTITVHTRSLFMNEGENILGVDPEMDEDYYIDYFRERNLLTITLGSEEGIERVTITDITQPDEVIIDGEFANESGIDYQFSDGAVTIEDIPPGSILVEIFYDYEAYDLDHDGIFDEDDVDDDNDGFPDYVEGLVGTDPKDAFDVPPDMDADGDPDALDGDIDGDGYLNDVDDLPTDKGEWLDTDGDGLGNNADPDDDDDGIPDDEDDFPLIPATAPTDNEGEGVLSFGLGSLVPVLLLVVVIVVIAVAVMIRQRTRRLPPTKVPTELLQVYPTYEKGRARGQKDNGGRRRRKVIEKPNVRSPKKRPPNGGSDLAGPVDMPIHRRTVEDEERSPVAGDGPEMTPGRGVFREDDLDGGGAMEDDPDGGGAMGYGALGRDTLEEEPGHPVRMETGMMDGRPARVDDGMAEPTSAPGTIPDGAQIGGAELAGRESPSIGGW